MLPSTLLPALRGQCATLACLLGAGPSPGPARRRDAQRARPQVSERRHFVELALVVPLGPLLARSAQRHVAPPSHLRADDSAAFQAGVARARHRSPGLAAHAAPLVRNAPAARRHRHPHGAGAARPQRREHHDDLHARAAHRGGHGGQPARPPAPRPHEPVPCSRPTPSCTAPATSPSCAAPRTPRNWSSARRRWATRRSRSPTSARSRASCARTSRPRNTGLPLLVGAEFSLGDAFPTCPASRANPPTRRDRCPGQAAARPPLRPPGPARADPQRLRQPLAADHRRAHARGQGRVPAAARRPRRGRRRLRRAAGALARARLRSARACRHRLAALAAFAEQAQLLSRAFPGRCWIAVELLARGRDAVLLERLRTSAGRSGCRWWPPATCSFTCARARACTTPSARSGSTTPVKELGHAIAPNAEQHLRSRLRLGQLYPAALLEETLEVASRCGSRSTSCATSTRRKSSPPARRPPRGCARSPTPACPARYPQGLPASVERQIEHELALIADLKYEPYFLTVADIVSFARAPGHPVPGPRLGGQLRGLLLPRHHRGRSGAHERALRALHQPRAQRAARHRRRFRAPAPRRSHPVHLREVRTAPRRAHRHRDQLPAQARRCATWAGRSASKRSGSTRSRRRTSGGTAGECDVDRLAETGFDPASPRRAPLGRHDHVTARLSASPLAAHRRLRDRARRAHAAGTGGKRRDARSHA